MPTKQKSKAGSYVSSARFRQHNKSTALPLGQRRAKKAKPSPAARPRKGVKRPGPVAVERPRERPHADFPIGGTFAGYPVLSGLPGLVYRSQNLKKTIAAGKEAEAQEKAIREEIEALLLAAGLDETTVTCGPYSVRRTEVKDKEVLSVDELRQHCEAEQIANAATGVDRERLLQEGVDADTIKACTITVPDTGYSYATVRLTKGKGSASGQDAGEEGGVHASA